jgi:hypothetical protein
MLAQKRVGIAVTAVTKKNRRRSGERRKKTRSQFLSQHKTARVVFGQQKNGEIKMAKHGQKIGSSRQPENPLAAWPNDIVSDLGDWSLRVMRSNPACVF